MSLVYSNVAELGPLHYSSTSQVLHFTKTKTKEVKTHLLAIESLAVTEQQPVRACFTYISDRLAASVSQCGPAVLTSTINCSFTTFI